MDSSVITTAVSGLVGQLTPIVVLGVAVWMGIFIVKKALWLIQSHIWYPYQYSRGKYD